MSVKSRMKAVLISRVLLVFFLVSLTAITAGKAAGDEKKPGENFIVGLETNPAVEALVDSQGVVKNYQVGTGDVLMLSVWKDSALSRQVVVLPDGTVSLPLIGELSVIGKSVAELEQEIIKKIRRYLPNPVLDVSVVNTNSMIIYVFGKVRAPGRYPMQSNLNVLQALAMAGGLDKYADLNDIKIFREEKNGTKIFSFECDEVLDGERLEQNIRLKRGDVIVVP